MRVLLVNTSERNGGAAIAASRLNEALKNNGVKAMLMVRDKETDQISVVELKKSWKLRWRFLRERFTIWKANRFDKTNLFAVDIATHGTDITTLPEFQKADLIHLHWINQGMLSLKDIQKIIASGKPIVWTMHDMWPFTGICHYADDCVSYRSGCHDCPQLKNGSAKDLSYKVFQRKLRLLSKAHITFVGCSRWLTEQARDARLLVGQTLTSIPNAINTHVFYPKDKQEVRNHYNLPQDKKLLLFGSAKITDPRKGMKYLLEACDKLVSLHPEWKDKIGVVVFGQQAEVLSSQLPFPVYVLSYIRNENELASMYSAVDLFVTPSLQDNLPNTLMEAMACGVPCVGFEVGGIPEMIDHEKNGYVARYKDSADLAEGIHWILSNPDYTQLSAEAVKKVEGTYSEGIVAMQYIRIYNKLCKRENA